MNKPEDKYNRRGVSSAKEDVHKAIRKLHKGLFPAAFCKVLPDYLGGDDAFCNLIHADGAGTKSSLAYLMWKETGDASVWKGIAQDSLVMNFDDMACAGVTSGFLISSTIGRNKNKIPGEVLAGIIEGTEEFIALMNELGVSCWSGGGETADLGDLVRTIVVDSTFTARCRRSDIIDNANIKAGLVIVGLASYGRASYERSYNSGISSNGLTAARHDALNRHYASFVESYDGEIPAELVYSGSRKLSDPVKVHYQHGAERIDEDIPVGKLLLSPTRCFTPVIASMLKAFRKEIKGLIHCTGGGQSKDLHFIRDVHVIKDRLFEPPPVFQMLAQESGAAPEEMYKVFNMGHRIQLFVEEALAPELIELAKSFSIDARIIGRTETWEGKKITLNTGSYQFSYTA